MIAGYYGEVAKITHNEIRTLTTSSCVEESVIPISDIQHHLRDDSSANSLHHLR